MPSGWEATGEVRWSSRWAAGMRFVNLLLASNPPCMVPYCTPRLRERKQPPKVIDGTNECTKCECRM